MPKSDPLDDCKAYVAIYDRYAEGAVRSDPTILANYAGYHWHIGNGKFSPNLHGQWSGCNDRYPSSPMGAVSELNVMIDLASRGYAVKGVSDKTVQMKGPDIILSVDDDTDVLVSVKTASGLSNKCDVMWLSDAVISDLERDTTSDMFMLVHNYNHVYMRVSASEFKRHTSLSSNVIPAASGRVGIRLTGLTAKVVLFKHAPS